MVTGLFDHTLDNTPALTNIAIGATIIKNQFTLDCNGGGPDASFSLELVKLAALFRGSKMASAALGTVDYSSKLSMQWKLKFHRSLNFVRHLSKGDIITSGAIRCVRPGFGISRIHCDEIVGRQCTEDCDANTPVTSSSIKSGA